MPNRKEMLELEKEAYKNIENTKKINLYLKNLSKKVKVGIGGLQITSNSVVCYINHCLSEILSNLNSILTCARLDHC